MAALKKVRGRTWEDKETKLLLEKWGEENIQIRLKSCTRKKPIWQEISGFVQASGFEDRDEEGCKTRIHTLICAYRTYKDECGKSGNGTPRKKPAFFHEVDELLSNKPCTKPKVVINSAPKVVLATASGGDDNIPENVPEELENKDPNIPSCSGSAGENSCQEPNKDVVCVTETSADEKKKTFVKTAHKRKISTTESFSRMDKSLEAFMNYQKEADNRFMEAEEARDRREEEREEKRRKEDQEFLLKLAQVLRK